MKNDESKIGECDYAPHEPPTQEELMAPVKGICKGKMNLKQQKVYPVPRVVDSFILTACLASISYAVQNLHVNPWRNGFCLLFLMLMTVYQIETMRNRKPTP